MEDDMNDFYIISDDGSISRRDGVPMGELTLKEMCDKIVEADFLMFKNGERPTAEQIYNSSPNGELSHIYFWYLKALEIIEKRIIINGE